MLQKSLFCLIILISTTIQSAQTQTIEIPDENFEQVLIDLGYDTNGMSGDILNIDAAGITYLSILDKSIASLDGIEGFTSLEYLDVSNNNLSVLNTNGVQSLEVILASHNPLTSIDVSNNENLIELYVVDALLEELDVSNNLLLGSLGCSNNAISSLDLSQNTQLLNFSCYSNQLTSLKIANGNNTNLLNIHTTDNPNLYCIKVDNAAYSNENWNLVDPQSYFSEDCTESIPTILIPDSNFEQALINQGFDTNGLNGNILQTEAEAIMLLDVSYAGIFNLEGIEGFTNLGSLDCSYNNLSSLDIRSNENLYNLNVANNLLTDLNVSNNALLNSLDVNVNQLTRLDVSQNSLLGSLNCSQNILTVLNIKNGFNNNFFIPLNASNNPDLYCIQVDNAPLSAALWTNIDSQSYFSEDCGYIFETTISGAAEWASGCGSRSMTVSLINEAGSELHYSRVMNSDGTFSFPVNVTGIFDIYIKVSGYLPKGFYNYEIYLGDNFIDVGDLTPGELTGDDGINIADVSVLNAAFGTILGSGNYNELADLNCDGGINISDVSILNANFGLVGAVFP